MGALMSTSGRPLQSFSFWLGCASPWVESFEKGQVRGVAQSGSALDWGSRGRRFESGRPDHSGSKASGERWGGLVAGSWRRARAPLVVLLGPHCSRSNLGRTCVAPASVVRVRDELPDVSRQNHQSKSVLANGAICCFHGAGI
jgi:hypothetical protein